MSWCWEPASQDFRGYGLVPIIKKALGSGELAYKVPAEINDETALTEGIILNDEPDKLSELFIKAIAQHRFWEREKPRKIPA